MALGEIAKVKFHIQRMYSAHTDSLIEVSEKKVFDLNDLDIGEDLVEIFFYAEGKTVAQYAKEIRVNQVKELLVYTNLPPSDISKKLHYCSVNEMEEELLQQTGLRISFFQDLKKQKAALAEHSIANKLSHYFS